MSEDEITDSKGKKKADYAEVEFEIGNIEFEAKGRSVVVERMFRLLLEKIEEGKLVAEFRLQDDDEEEEEEEEFPPEMVEYVEEESEPSLDSEPTLDPPPAWDILDSEEPEVSDAEREEFDL
ncbi:hypothetical protein EU527_03620 [Candidatus Thorarchaeota archaeon]|nr:MAG: hypothetical protein EU527_03620 [Candidatus Thorarchaeota archaeon]